MPTEGAATRKKAPKSAAPAAAAVPEPDLTKEEAVEELAQALLREFMHKKGAKAALTVFDDENARTDKTIKSRAVMTSLMSMQAIQARNAKAATPHATFMEQLCGYRLRKRRIAKGDAEAAHDDSSGAEDGPSAAKTALEESKARIAQLRAALDAAKAERESAIAAAVAKKDAAAETAATSGDGEAPKKEKKAKKAKKGDAADGGDDAKKKQKKAAKKTAAAAGGSKAFDPLGLGGGSSGADGAEDDGLLSAGRSGASSGSFGGPVGHSWNPAGAGLNIPEVGIGGHHAAAPAPAADGDKDAPPPSAVKFMAGKGMNLMATKVRAVAERDQMHFDDSPAKGRRRSSLDAVGTGMGAATTTDVPSPGWEYDYPSPEGGRKQYDPRASGSGVLKKEEKKPRSERRVVIMAAEETE